MARTSVTVRISDSRIKLLGAPTNMVGRYVHRKGDTVERWAEIGCPTRSGALQASIGLGPVVWRGHRTSVTISADAGYARWVHDGTGPFIYPHGDYLSVPKFWSITGANVPRQKRAFVRGQDAQPFLRNALVFVMTSSRFVRSRGR